jgi:hypothetical protein
VTLEAYERNPALRKRPVQASQCGVSGEVFVKAIVGRHRHRNEEELTQRLVRLQVMIQQIGGDPPHMPVTTPLWYQAEFLENLIEFDLNPPCGCAPATVLAQG